MPMNLSVRDVSELLNVSEKTIYRWIRERNMPVIRIQDQYRFSRVELMEWAISERIPVSPEIFREPESKNQPLPLLSEALEAGGIFYRIEGKTRDEVLKEAVKRIHLPEHVDRDFLFAVLQAREELASTGIGDGIALPHVRNPVVLHVTHPSITLCFLEHPVDFGAIDNQPVTTLFILLSPTIRAHLHMISHLSVALRDPSLRALLREQGTREAILNAFRALEKPPSDAANRKTSV